jgi:hypothetical protein
VTFGLDSLLHEDNRYFNSGKKGFWPRTGYAVASGILAQHDDGTQHLSIPQIGGVAAGAFLSRSWQPSSQHSAGNGAVSFGISMASNMAFGVVKEFLPDLGRAITNKRKKHSSPLKACLHHSCCKHLYTQNPRFTIHQDISCHLRGPRRYQLLPGVWIEIRTTKAYIFLRRASSGNQPLVLSHLRSY